MGEYGGIQGSPGELWRRLQLGGGGMGTFVGAQGGPGGMRDKGKHGRE